MHVALACVPPPLRFPKKRWHTFQIFLRKRWHTLFWNGSKKVMHLWKNSKRKGRAPWTIYLRLNMALSIHLWWYNYVLRLCMIRLPYLRSPFNIKHLEGLKALAWCLAVFPSTYCFGSWIIPISSSIASCHPLKYAFASALRFKCHLHPSARPIGSLLQMRIHYVSAIHWSLKGKKGVVPFFGDTLQKR